MTTYEYATINRAINDETSEEIDVLNSFGKEGWRLVSIDPFEAPVQDSDVEDDTDEDDFQLGAPLINTESFLTYYFIRELTGG